MDRLEEKIRVFKDIFGEDHFYIDIENNKIQMERWNNYDITLSSILETRYLNYIAKETGNEEKMEEYFWEGIKLQSNSEKTKIGKFLDDLIIKVTCVGETKYIDKENYIKYQKKELFKILDVLIKDSQKRLKYQEGNGYLFNWENSTFIEFLLDMHDAKDKQYRALMEGSFEDLDEEHAVILFTGIKNLLESEKNSLKFEDLQPSVQKFFKEEGPNYRENQNQKELKELIDDLEWKILYYASQMCSKNDKGEVVADEIKLTLEVYNRLMDMLIDKLEFPNITEKEWIKLSKKTSRYMQKRHKDKEKEISSRTRKK